MRSESFFTFLRRDTPPVYWRVVRDRWCSENIQRAFWSGLPIESKVSGNKKSKVGGIPSGGIRDQYFKQLLVSLLQWGRQMGRRIIARIRSTSTPIIIQAFIRLTLRKMRDRVSSVSILLTVEEREWCRLTQNPYAILNIIPDEDENNSSDISAEVAKTDGKTAPPNLRARHVSTEIL